MSKATREHSLRVLEAFALREALDPAVQMWAAKSPGHGPIDVARSTLERFAALPSYAPSPVRENILPARDVLASGAADADECSAAFAAALLARGVSIRFVLEAYDQPDNYTHVVVDVRDGDTWQRFDPTYGGDAFSERRRERMPGRPLQRDARTGRILGEEEQASGARIAALIAAAHRNSAILAARGPGATDAADALLDYWRDQAMYAAFSVVRECEWYGEPFSTTLDHAVIALGRKDAAYDARLRPTPMTVFERDEDVQKTPEKP